MAQYKTVYLVKDHEDRVLGILEEYPKSLRNGKVAEVKMFESWEAFSDIHYDAGPGIYDWYYKEIS